MDLNSKIIIRKKIARYKRLLSISSGNERLYIIKIISKLLKKIAFNEAELANIALPTLGKIRLVIEKDLKAEQHRLENDPAPSPNDLKRLALKSSVYEYYMDLNYNPDIVAVDYYGAMILRRDDKEVDKTDFDLAPNKNDIYNRWMEKLSRLIRENSLSKAEFDESIERGTPQGGAFEKQLDRYRKDFMKQLWQSYQ